MVGADGESGWATFQRKRAGYELLKVETSWSLGPVFYFMNFFMQPKGAFRQGANSWPTNTDLPSKTFTLTLTQNVDKHW